MRSLTFAKEQSIKPKSSLQARLAMRAEADAAVQAAFAKARRAERQLDTASTKRKPNDELARYLAVSLHHRCVIRPDEGYQARTYNLPKQVIGLVDHLFVRYPVPLFLYRSVLSYEGIELVFGDRPPAKDHRRRSPAEGMYRQWFVAVARGDSLAKLTKGIFSKREAHWFLQAPPGNRIEQNILWARAAAAGVPPDGCSFIVERYSLAELTRVGDRLSDLLRFYGQAWPSMRRGDQEEITDFLQAAMQDPRFSLKGRTYGSMRKLCHDWHRTLYTGTVREYRSWVGVYGLWQHQRKGTLIRGCELTNNRALADEGNRQLHCVFGYTDRCVRGASRIVSMRWFAGDTEVDRITLEIDPARREIVQVRGRMNRRATEEEMKDLRHWAGDHGLSFGASAQI